MFRFIALTHFLIFIAIAAPIDIHLNNPDQMVRERFLLELPTNETVQITIKFKLLKRSQPLPLYKALVSENLTYNSTKATTMESNETPPIQPTNVTSTNSNDVTSTEPNEIASTLPAELQTLPQSSNKTEANEDQLFLLTVDEAIEVFRQHLVEQEQQIAGIIESETPFYRHFKLRYNSNFELPIRCTYDANFINKTLKISCYEYREFGKERILSNGEFESLSLTTNPEYIDVRNATQTLSMTIT